MPRPLSQRPSGPLDLAANRNRKLVDPDLTGPAREVGPGDRAKISAQSRQVSTQSRRDYLAATVRFPLLTRLIDT